MNCVPGYTSNYYELINCAPIEHCLYFLCTNIKLRLYFQETSVILGNY